MSAERRAALAGIGLALLLLAWRLLVETRPDRWSGYLPSTPYDGEPLGV